jgi:S-(hydroxymethyl)glutathione dehydrogenase/alcohol dehydrogenase|tara:strand:- start:20 stop:1072 length:1053 start_codon:yes stop_codon:yes gene_type:complete
MKIETMKAAILVEQNQPLTVDEVGLPSELDFGQVLVKVHCSGICGSQLGEIAGVKGLDLHLPHLLGHEGSGIVADTGPNVSRFKEGDHVVLHWRPSNGIESKPPKYSWNGKTLNAGLVTTFNQYAIVSENRLTIIPDNFDMKSATLFGCAVTTAFGVVNNDAKIKVGQSIVILGVGGLGLNIAQAASMVSAYPIVGMDLLEHKLEMGRKFGLTHAVVGGEGNINDAIRDMVGPQGADVVIETTGNSRMIEQAYELTQPDGKTILVGVPNKGDNISIYSLPLHFNKVLTGSHGGDAVPDLDVPRYIKLINAGKMTLDGFITHEFALDEINAALDLFRSGKVGRIVIKMNSN